MLKKPMRFYSMSTPDIIHQCDLIPEYALFAKFAPADLFHLG